MGEPEIRVEHKTVAGQHVFTSPDMPELWVAHRDRAVAAADVVPSIRMILKLRGQAAGVAPKVIGRAA